VVVPKAVNPANDERAARAQHVESPLALGTLDEPCAHAALAKGDAWIGTLGDIRKLLITVYDREAGRFETTLLKVNYGMI
jgi:hypothetical protein